MRVGLALRLKDAEGAMIWTRRPSATASESAVRLNRPGSDPCRLRLLFRSRPRSGTFCACAMRRQEALKPLIGALTVHYGYKPLE